MDAVIVSLVASAIVPDAVGEALPAPRVSRRAASRRVAAAASPPCPARRCLRAYHAFTYASPAHRRVRASKMFHE